MMVISWIVFTKLDRKQSIFHSQNQCYFWLDFQSKFQIHDFENNFRTMLIENCLKFLKCKIHDEFLHDFTWKKVVSTIISKAH